MTSKWLLLILFFRLFPGSTWAKFKSHHIPLLICMYEFLLYASRHFDLTLIIFGLDFECMASVGLG